MSEAQDPISGTVLEGSVVEESDEGELLEDIQEDDSVTDTPAASTPVPETPAKAPPASTPGKVQPSPEVAGLQFNSPAGSNLKPEKNPFPTYGNWTVKDMAEITVDFPILSSKNETTNELTRKNRPEARYWRGPISFKYGQYTSTTMRFNNVGVPFHTGRGYGENYIYICLPKHVGDAFSVAGKTRAPTRVNETSLQNDENRWWKIVNNVDNKIGIVDNRTKKFMPKGISTIFDSTQSGIIISAILAFHCKASTGDSENIKSTTTRTVSVELVRGFIEKTDENVQGPVRIIASKKEQADPAATKSDIASDDLMKRLADLGL